MFYYFTTKNMKVRIYIPQISEIHVGKLLTRIM